MEIINELITVLEDLRMYAGKVPQEIDDRANAAIKKARISQDNILIDLVKQPGKLKAIKYYKDITGCSLKEAHFHIIELKRNLGMQDEL